MEIEYIHSSLRKRKKLAYSYGNIVGYMHKNEVYDVVRYTDVICTSDEIIDFKKSMITIDRERSRKSKKRFPESRRRKIFNKARCLAMTLLADARSHILPMPSYYEILAFLAGYFSENRETKGARDKLINYTKELLNDK